MPVPAKGFSPAVRARLNGDFDGDEITNVGAPQSPTSAARLSDVGGGSSLDVQTLVAPPLVWTAETTFPSWQLVLLDGVYLLQGDNDSAETGASPPDLTGLDPGDTVSDGPATWWFIGDTLTPIVRWEAETEYAEGALVLPAEGYETGRAYVMYPGYAGETGTDPAIFQAFEADPSDGYITDGPTYWLPVSSLSSEVSLPTLEVVLAAGGDGGGRDITGVNDLTVDHVVALGVSTGGISVSTDGMVTASIYSGSVDPSAGGGFGGEPGSIYMRSTGEVWAKTGAGETDWQKVVLL